MPQLTILPILFIFLFSSTLPVKAKEIEVITGLSRPPYIFEDQRQGFEIELIKSIFNKMGLTPIFIHIPIERTKEMFLNNKTSSMLTVTGTVINNKALISDHYVTYHNVAISLKSSQLQIKKIKDLQHLKVASFYMANKLLGGEFQSVVKNSGSYIEFTDQFRQIKLLLENKVDVLIMDINIYRYYLSLIELQSMDMLNNIHNLFPPIDYSMAFAEKGLVVEFNKKLKEVKQSGEYEHLLTKYQLLSQQ